MTAGRRYLLGVTTVAVAALLLSLVVPPDARTGLRVVGGAAARPRARAALVPARGSAHVLPGGRGGRRRRRHRPTMSRIGGLAAALLLVAVGTAAAQEHTGASRSNEIDIMAHLGNSHSIE